MTSKYRLQHEAVTFDSRCSILAFGSFAYSIIIFSPSHHLSQIMLRRCLALEYGEPHFQATTLPMLPLDRSVAFVEASQSF